eukprot:COSAG01_NODE_10255_length_2209_cov_2.009005_1_plen_37_part_10
MSYYYQHTRASARSHKVAMQHGVDARAIGRYPSAMKH